ncbi:hypothetical protein Cflav_PD3470 [Pedosphaera parvula Ellin514]|uniref:Lipoprotein n=2 Tax=Pedosphaera TaxID=1032526 RepID=B9XI07_PEDPL|nr:hypothetical protein Cflav_PD3470 [Pedosphaera parvula Ellin514]
MKTIHKCPKAYLLGIALSCLFLVSGCGSSVGQPTKFQNKEDAAKHVLGIYKQVYDDSLERETENAKNDLNRPDGVSPGNHYFLFSVLPEGKIYSWAFNDRLKMITPFGKLMENKPDSYTLEKQSDDCWILTWDGNQFAICDNGLMWVKGQQTNKFVRESNKPVSSLDEVFIYHGRTPIKLDQ